MEMIQLFWEPGGLGRRNARGQLLARWVLHGLCILSRLETNMPMAESWTCKRVADNALTQLDFIIGGLQFEDEKSWHDNCLGTGLDHRCVHSKLRVRIAKRSLAKRMSGLKNWQPFVDNDGKASGFQSSVRKLLRTNTNPTLPALESMLLTAGRETWPMQDGALYFSTFAAAARFMFTAPKHS